MSFVRCPICKGDYDERSRLQLLKTKPKEEIFENGRLFGRKEILKELKKIIGVAFKEEGEEKDG